MITLRKLTQQQQFVAFSMQRSAAAAAAAAACFFSFLLIESAMAATAAGGAAAATSTNTSACPPAAAPSSSASSCVLQSLDLHPSLRSRIHEVCPPASSAFQTSPSSPASDTTTKPGNGNAAAAADASSAQQQQQQQPRLNAVLYLPTVVLRYEHNPAFALACRVANSLHVPLLVLAVVPDDASTPKHRSNVPIGLGGVNGETSSANSNASGAPGPNPNIAMTSRRLSLHLEALSSAAQSWSAHGAGCAVRLHGPQCRTPDHLTLARRVRFVVADEPFVDPYLGLVQRVERAARGAGVRCVRVDGSTTVPPCSVLRRLARRRIRGGGTTGSGTTTSAIAMDDDDPAAPLLWEGVPAKAWMWQKRTESERMGQVRAAVVEGAFDAPELKVKIARDRFFEEVGANADADADTIGEEDGGSHESPCPSTDPAFLAALPPTWRNPQASAPGTKPWSTADLASLANANRLQQFALSWPGADPTVPPCPQTIGTTRAGMVRWNSWVRNRSGLAGYGKRRNDPRQPHAPSRMSAYLNLGIVSIFRLVHEVKAAQAQRIAGADKYEEEIVKWREMAYAFCFSRTDYCGEGAVPHWARRSLEQQQLSSRNGGGGLVTSPFGWNSLALGRTGHDKWDAMQRYLVSTGELHNNVRMTWGKTVVGWSSRVPREEGLSVTASVLQTLCYLNDRYALDGLSPPSYAGLLWCLGWCDKPGKGGGPSPKPASNYRYSPEDFQFAERALLAGPGGNSGAGISSDSQGNGSATSKSMKHGASQSSILDMMKKQQPKAKKQRTGDEGEEKESSTMKESIRSASKTSPGVNGTVKKNGSIANFFSPKTT